MSKIVKVLLSLAVIFGWTFAVALLVRMIEPNPITAGSEYGTVMSLVVVAGCIAGLVVIWRRRT